MSETLQEEIDNIMDTFDFGRVQDIMETVCWIWGGDGSDAGVPDETELRKAARRLLNRLRECRVAGSGGFTAIRSEDDVMLFWGIDSLDGGE